MGPSVRADAPRSAFKRRGADHAPPWKVRWAVPAPGPSAPRPRVCLLIGNLARGGAETQLVELALGLRRKRYSVEVVLLKERNDFADELAAAGIRVTALDRMKWDASVPLRLYAHLRATRPDVLHSFLPVANLVGVAIGRLARVPRIVASIRCSCEGAMGRTWRRVARWSHRLADRVIVNSEAARREEIAAGFPADRIDYVPNGLRTPAAPRATRESLGLPEGPLVLAVGQLEAVKGHRHLIQAWPLVRAAVPDATLALVGAGSSRVALETAADRLGVAGSVRFLGFRESARPYLHVCDVLAQPSLSEGMPNAILEAMVARRPVVATDVGGIPEVVRDGATGTLVPPANPAALARAIVELLTDPTRRAAMGEAGWRRVQELFRAERMVQRTEDAYARAARPATAPAAHERVAAV